MNFCEISRGCLDLNGPFSDLIATNRLHHLVCPGPLRKTAALWGRGLLGPPWG